MNAEQYHVTVTHDGKRAVELLAAKSQLSKQRIKLAMQRGAVWLTRGRHTTRLRRASRSLRAGDELHLYYNDKVLDETPIAPRLVADETCFSVWDKPSGLRSQGSKWGDHCTVVRWAEQHLQPQRSAFTVHRLDRAASGLLVIAHTKTAAADLSRQFRERRVDKEYRAVVHGDVSAHEQPLHLTAPIDGKSAESFCRFVASHGAAKQSLIDVAITTGRKHQIRRHLAAVGFPIVGDRLYGHAGPDAVDLQLRAVRLAFTHPIDARPVAYSLATNDGTDRNPAPGGES